MSELRLRTLDQFICAGEKNVVAGITSSDIHLYDDWPGMRSALSLQDDHPLHSKESALCKGAYHCMFPIEHEPLPSVIGN